MYKFTKNVATIGPVTETEEMLEKLMKAGMNVARFNTKHGTPEWHQERITRTKNVAKRLGLPIGILLDLQGPEIRINLPEEKPIEVEEGDLVYFTFNADLDKPNKIIIPKNVIDTVSVDNLILLDDGFCEFVVTYSGKEYLEAKALTKATVKHRKTMNIPGITIDMPALIDADYVQLDGIKEDNIDFVALSFVRTKEDIEYLRSELKKRNVTADIVAKIETQAAIDNLEEIIDAADAVMVARGDLGVELPMEELVYWQKQCIDLCRAKGKPVITATQMLKSMCDFPRPTRAEVSDVAHSIYDCTSAVMLSEETTIGSYPVKAVATQATISKFNESKVVDYFRLESGLEYDDNASAIAENAIDLLETSTEPIDAIVCLTATGRTANLLSSLRPDCPIIAVTHNEDTFYRLSLSYAVYSKVLDNEILKDNNVPLILDELKKQGVLEEGQKVIVISGQIPLTPNLTNSLCLLNI